MMLLVTPGQVHMLCPLFWNTDVASKFLMTRWRQASQVYLCRHAPLPLLRRLA